MQRKYLNLKSNDELVVFNNKDSVLIKSKDKKLIISKIERTELDNIYIKLLSYAEITNLVLTYLLENNHIDLNANKSKLTNHELIKTLLDRYYNFFHGKINKDVKDMYFECITEYEN